MVETGRLESGCAGNGTGGSNPSLTAMLSLDFDPCLNFSSLLAQVEYVCIFSRVGLVLLCPITSQIKGYPFQVLIPEGAKIQGAILSDQVKSLDWQARNSKFIGNLPGSVTQEVLSKLSTLLGD